jgi:hypothetical protein
MGIGSRAVCFVVFSADCPMAQPIMKRKAIDKISGLMCLVFILDNIAVFVFLEAIIQFVDAFF